MPLNLDHRPKDFASIYGNQATIESLKAIFSREYDYPHAMLMQGPKGCGKTTIARIVVGLLGCKGSDFIEINSSNDRGIQTARNIMEGAKYRPMMGKARVYLLDEVHSATKDFMHAMLKPLEDAPKHAYYILCTTDPAMLIEPLRSRCHTFEVQYLNQADTLALLGDVLTKENVADIPETILKKIYEASDGCPRDALRILDQVIDMEPDRMEAGISSFFYGEKQVNDFCQALLKKQSWSRVRLIVKQMDLSNPESARRGVIGYMAAVIAGGDNPLAAVIYEAFREPLYATGKAGFWFAAYRATVEAGE